MQLVFSDLSENNERQRKGGNISPVMEEGAGTIPWPILGLGKIYMAVL